MDARAQELIDYYLPHQPDPSLQLQEFYYLQYTAGTPRVIRVYALDILPCKDGYEYGIYQMRGGQLHWVDVGYESMVRGCRMVTYMTTNRIARTRPIAELTGGKK